MQMLRQRQRDADAQTLTMDNQPLTQLDHTYTDLGMPLQQPRRQLRRTSY